MNIPFVQTSVFADERFKFSGNQLATFYDLKLNSEIETEIMQGIALEMNFSETTFLLPTNYSQCACKVRIFTPGAELSFAGHPTLGSTFVLKLKNLVPTDTIETNLELGIGPTPVKFLGENRIEMSQNVPQFFNFNQDPKEILNSIGLSKSDVNSNALIQVVSTGSPFIIIPIKNLASLKKAVPNPTLIFDAIRDIPDHKILIITTDTKFQDSDIHVRIFAPQVGVLEDPATGSAAGPLGAYLVKNELAPPNKNIIIEQGYEINRPSKLLVYVKNLKERILVSGRVKVMAEGTFFV